MERVASETPRLDLIKELDFLNPFPITSQKSTIASFAFRAYLYKKWLMIGIEKLQKCVPGDNDEDGQSDALKSMGNDHAGKRKIEIDAIKKPSRKQIKVPVEPPSLSVIKNTMPCHGFGTQYRLDHLYRACRSQYKSNSSNIGSRQSKKIQAVQKVSLSSKDILGSCPFSSTSTSLGFESGETANLFRESLASKVLVSPSSACKTLYSALTLDIPIPPQTKLITGAQSPNQKGRIIFSGKELQDFENIMKSPLLFGTPSEKSQTLSPCNVPHRPVRKVLSPWNSHTPGLFSPSITSLQEAMVKESLKE